MAQAMITDTQLRMVFDHGMDLDGNQISKNKNFNNVKPTATTDNLFAIAQALAPIQTHPLQQIERNDSFDLIADPQA